MDELMDGLMGEWKGWREREEGEKKRKGAAILKLNILNNTCQFLGENTLLL